MTALFARARDVTRYTSEMIRAPRRMLPSEATRLHLETEKGRWDPSLAPMMVEPLDLLASREYRGVVFVGPARTGKTMALILGGVTYVVTCAPGDVLITQMSQDTARDFSLTDLDRAIRHSTALREALSPRARDDNTYDKFFRSGMRLKVGWPSISQLSSKTLRYVFLTDYDRPENRDNVDGEGPLWDLGAKRVETYMSRGKCFAESSPDAEYLDAGWKPASPHEGPPSRGIVELYNRGTRARWYWPCWHCSEFFQAAPGLECFALPGARELEELVRERDPLELATRFAKVVCPECGGLHEQRQRPEMSARGHWLHEGQTISRDAEITGGRRGTQIASYWLGGVAAAYQSWESILLKYMQALASYLRTGEEGALKFTVNTDQGAAYLPRVVSNRRSAEDLRRRLENWPKGKVPAGVRFLTAQVDVQQSKFVVHVTGWGVGLESWLIDRFPITSSKRAEGKRTAALDPAAYLEDWDVLLEQVMDRRYTVVGTDYEMPVTLTVCDSGGKAGVTSKAYGYWRWLKKRGKHRRFRLLKGSSSRDAATIAVTWPDTSDRKDRKQGGRGDVPVMLINTNVLKDAVVGDLARAEPGPGYVHLPTWLDKDDGYFAEIVAETRTEKGWRNPNRERNEAFDLHAYGRAACKVLRADRINWQAPPRWALTVEEQIAAIARRKAAAEATETAEPSAVTAEPRRPRKPIRPSSRKNWVNWRS